MTSFRSFVLFIGVLGSENVGHSFQFAADIHRLMPLKPASLEKMLKLLNMAGDNAR